jgi:hypothetical protein
MQDADGGHVGHGLGQRLVGLGQAGGASGEQIKGAEAVVSQAHRHGVDRGEAGVEGRQSEMRPAGLGFGEVVLADHLSSAPAVQTRAILTLHLDQFEVAHALARGGQCAQLAPRVSQHHSRLGHPQRRHAALGQPEQELDGVIALDQGVGQLHEGTR